MRLVIFAYFFQFICLNQCWNRAVIYVAEGLVILVRSLDIFNYISIHTVGKLYFENNDFSTQIWCKDAALLWLSWAMREMGKLRHIFIFFAPI